MSRREITAAAGSEFFEGVRHAAEFFIGKADVQRALEILARRLEELEIPYAIVGDGDERIRLSAGHRGSRRAAHTGGARPVQAALARQGIRREVRRQPRLRDTEHGVPIDVVVTGDYPGDGRPKPVVFPDPADHARRGSRVRLLPLPRLIELELASGMSAPHRLRDLADVLELISRHRPAAGAGRGSR